MRRAALLLDIPENSACPNTILEKRAALDAG